jgi:carbon storage regulator
MLVLRRKAGEAIVLNGVITIHVLAVEGERVKLGISAPPEVVIVRSELLENQGSTPSGPGQSGSYWQNRDVQRPPRERGTGPGDGEGRAAGDIEARNLAAPRWGNVNGERSATAPIRVTPHLDEE